MARNVKYSFGDNEHRMYRLSKFENTELVEHIRKYREVLTLREYKEVPPVEEELLQRLMRREYRNDPTLLPRFYRIPWEDEDILWCFQKLRSIWEGTDE